MCLLIFHKLSNHSYQIVSRADPEERHKQVKGPAEKLQWKYL
jgi:hypothetical protein